jgi:hypothetical protein
MVLMGSKSPRGGTPLSLVKRIRIPTHTSHDAGGAICPSQVPLLDHLVSEAVGTIDFDRTIAEIQRDILQY